MATKFTPPQPDPAQVWRGPGRHAGRVPMEERRRREGGWMTRLQGEDATCPGDCLWGRARARPSDPLGTLTYAGVALRLATSGAWRQRPCDRRTPTCALVPPQRRTSSAPRASERDSSPFMEVCADLMILEDPRAPTSSSTLPRCRDAAMPLAPGTASDPRLMSRHLRHVRAAGEASGASDVHRATALPRLLRRRLLHAAYAKGSPPVSTHRLAMFRQRVGCRTRSPSAVDRRPSSAADPPPEGARRWAAPAKEAVAARRTH